MMWYTVTRKTASSMVTTTTTAFCLCMSFAASSYWSVTCARARSTAPSMPGRSWHCWLNDCDRSGHKSELSSVATPVFAAGGMLLWCERNNVGYIVGIAKNKRLNALTAQRQRDARDCYAELGAKVRWFTDIHYAAGSWDRKRRVIAKIEHTAKGSNPRYVVTTLKGAGKTLYDKLYCARGEMENRIKEQQLDLFADRTSCHRWWPNQFRLLLSSLAYMLLEAIRRLALQGTELANAYVGTLRLKLLKVGAVILRNTRRIRFLLSSACPYQRLFFHVAARLAPG